MSVASASELGGAESTMGRAQLHRREVGLARINRYLSRDLYGVRRSNNEARCSPA